MPPQNSQAPQQDMNPDEIAAILGLLTTVGTNHMKSQMPQEAPPETPQAPVEAPQAPDLAPEVEKLQKEVDALKKQIQKDPKDDLAEIRKQVEEALAADDTKDNGGQK